MKLWTDVGERVWRKLQLFAVGLLHLLFSCDQLCLQIEAPVDAVESRDDVCSPLLQAIERQEQHISLQRKRIVFVRHAESEWNVLFNRGLQWRAPFQFTRAVVREWLLLPTKDSLFLDSPLSAHGLQQAQTLFDHVCEQASPPEAINEAKPEHLLRYLCCPLPNSMVVASNLRRAIDTARIASAARLELPGEQIHVLSCLQEIGRNVDTLAISDAYAIEPRVLAKSVEGEKPQEDLFNLSESHGNKSVQGMGRQRLVTFAKWCFCQQEDVLVVYGHSNWFQAFCQDFLPMDCTIDAKKTKLRNCGVVSFYLQEQRIQTGAVQYSIDPASFQHVR